MRKIINVFTISALVLSISCSNEGKVEFDANAAIWNGTRSELASEHFHATLEEAKVMSNIRHKDLYGKESQIKSIILYPCDESPTLYMINYSEGGFNVISADKRTEPLLYYSEEGEISMPIENRNFLFMLQYLSERIEKLQSCNNADEIQMSNCHKWNVVTGVCLQQEIKTKVRPDYIYIIQRCNVKDTLFWGSPMCDTKWGPIGQNSYEFFNYYCPYSGANEISHASASYVAVAGAQALYTLHKENNVPITIPENAFVIPGQVTYTSQQFSSLRSSTYIDEMPLTEFDTNEDKREHVRIFLAHIGHIIGTSYGYPSSSASAATLQTLAFPNYYVQSYSSFGTDNALNDILSHAPKEKVIILKSGSGESGAIGDAWISDGFREIYSITTDYCYNSGSTPLTAEQQFYLTMDDWNYVTTSRGYDRRFHMNWGHYGLHDGWLSFGPSNGFINSSYNTNLEVIWF